MGIVASIVAESTQTDAYIRLWHGTALTIARSIASDGVSLERMTQTCEGAWRFCASINTSIAADYAGMNVLVQTSKAIPVLLGFDIPKGTLRRFFTNMPPVAYEVLEDQAVEFEPETFAILNREMRNFSVVTVTELNSTTWAIKDQ